MRKLAGRMAITCVGMLAAAATVFSSPAQAATNPFTPAQACNNDFGGSWAHANDGHRAIKNNDGAVVGDVYLMYDHSTAKNCVATIKRVAIGSGTHTNAYLDVDGDDNNGYNQGGDFKYYAAVAHDARDRCVQYEGTVETSSGWHFHAGRYTWGNCG